jgi:hypothetical protein
VAGMGTDGRIILGCALKVGCDDNNSIHLAQDRDQCWAFVNIVMNLLVPLEVGNFFIS